MSTPKIPLPSLKKLEEIKNHKNNLPELDQTSLEVKRQNLGWIGRISGNKDEKAGNTAFTVITICFVFLGLILFLPLNHSNVPMNNLIAILKDSIVLSLGYLFGKEK